MGVTAASGMVGVKSLADHTEPDQAKYHLKTVKDLLKQATNGDVECKWHRLLPNNRTEYILTLNSFDHETKIREAVIALKFPWAVERTEDLGRRDNPNSLMGGEETGFPTLLIVRKALYKPQTSPFCMVLSGITIAVVALFVLIVLYWLFHLMSRS
jgi:hypothetical protein